jgi:hypothetical protein
MIILTFLDEEEKSLGILSPRFAVKEQIGSVEKVVNLSVRFLFC